MGSLDIDWPVLGVSFGISAIATAAFLAYLLRSNRARRPVAGCGLTLGLGEHTVFVCVLEPHAGDVHANPGAIARIQGDRWTIERGRSLDLLTGTLRSRDFMAEARAANPKPTTAGKRR